MASSTSSSVGSWPSAADLDGLDLSGLPRPRGNVVASDTQDVERLSRMNVLTTPSDEGLTTSGTVGRKGTGGNGAISGISLE